MEQKIEEEPKTLTERMSAMEELFKDPKKVKPLKLPRKARVKRNKRKKGWIGIVRVMENGNMTGTKVRIDGSTFDFFKQNGHYHMTDGREIGWWEGKHPVIFQEDKKVNPKLFKFNEGKNETYGQKKIIASILKDTITKTKKGGGIGWIAVLAVIGIVIWILGTYVFHWF